MSWLTSIADEIAHIGLAFIEYELVSLLASITAEIVPSGLALIGYKIVTGFIH